MAVRDDWAPGEVLTSTDLNDTFAAKLNTSGAKILQTVSTTKTDTSSLSVASKGYSSDITGLTVSITPTSSASKILLFYTVNAARSGDYPIFTYRLMRGATAIGLGTAAGSRVSVTGSSFIVVANAGSSICVSGQYLDSPATTSATTYAIQAFNNSSVTETFYINRTATDTDNNNFTRTISTITAMEVSA